MKRAAVEEAIAAIARRGFVIVLDEEDAESRGDLIAAADGVRADHIAFMVRHTSGVLWLSMAGERLAHLELPSNAVDRAGSQGAPFAPSIDLAGGSSCGASAEDRARTIRAAVDPTVPAGEFQRPGHIFPLRCRPGGVLAHPSHAEAAVDLVRLAGLAPAGVVCEVVDDTGALMTGDPLARFARDNGIPIITIQDLALFRWRNEALVDREAEAALPTSIADFRAIGYRARHTGSEHIALVLGDVVGRSDVLTRLHSVCLTGDVFGSLRCDCGVQLREAMTRIAREGSGIIVYNPTHEGRGTGLIDKLAAYHLQEQGIDTAEANEMIGHAVDARHYGIDAQILHDLKVTSVRLLTNNPEKIEQLRLFGVEVSDRVPLWVGENDHNRFYLSTKTTRLGHLGGP